jgi:hypothetical protein
MMAAPRPFAFLGPLTVDENAGATELLRTLTQDPSIGEVTLVAITLAPTSGAGVWRSDGALITSATDGLFFPAGGGVIYLYTADEVRFFRMRTNAGVTATVTVQAYRQGRQ